MLHDAWRIIPKRSRWCKLTLKVEVKPSDGFRRLCLFIPMGLRRKTGYFKSLEKLMYCNLLERGSLVMIQFIPEESLVEDSRRIYHGQLYLARDVLQVDLDGHTGRFEIPYRMDKGNIVIDRGELGDLEEVG